MPYYFFISPFINWFIAYSLYQIHDDIWYLDETFQLRDIIFKNFKFIYDITYTNGGAFILLVIFYFKKLTGTYVYTKFGSKKNIYLNTYYKNNRKLRKLIWSFENKR